MGLWQAAAANNARWCDLIARSHGLRTRSDSQAWTCQSRTPPLYPDAVTLVQRLAAADLLAPVDASPGCSVKDSFGLLDLGPRGFRVLFEAGWIARPAAGPPGAPRPGHPAWRRIAARRPGAVAAGVAARRRSGGGPSGLFRASLLDHRQVAVLAAQQDGQIVAGAIVCADPEVAGISSFFAQVALPER